MKQRRSISNRPLNHANFISRFMRIHPSALKFIINESIKKKRNKSGTQKGHQLPFPFRSSIPEVSIHTRRTVDATLLPSFHRYGSFADTIVRFFIRVESMQCGIPYHEKYLCVIHEGREFFVTFPSCLLSSSLVENSIDVSRIIYETPVSTMHSFDLPMISRKSTKERFKNDS